MAIVIRHSRCQVTDVPVEWEANGGKGAARVFSSALARDFHRAVETIREGAALQFADTPIGRAYRQQYAETLRATADAIEKAPLVAGTLVAAPSKPAEDKRTNPQRVIDNAIAYVDDEARPSAAVVREALAASGAEDAERVKALAAKDTRKGVKAALVEWATRTGVAIE